MKTDLWIMLSIGVAAAGGNSWLPAPHRLAQAAENEVGVVLTYGARSGCFGSGPCRIELADGEPYVKQEGMAQGLLRYTGQGRLVLSIEAASMMPATVDRQLGKGQLELPQAFQVPAGLLQALHVPDTALWLPPGLYDAPLEEGHYRINF